jgi:peptidoglycan-associated lipoprotein
MTRPTSLIRLVSLASAALLLVGVVACRQDKRPKTTDQPAAKTTPVETPGRSEVEVAPSKTYETPKPEKTVKVDPLAGTYEEIANKNLQDVFYDFDKFDLGETARQSLAANGDFLKANPSVRITIAGHCDERGTRDYNISLGQKRAEAAKEYLIALGVAEDRISTVSYGKERPFDPGHDEDAWAKNRRGHFVVTAK